MLDLVNCHQGRAVRSAEPPAVTANYHHMAQQVTWPSRRAGWMLWLRILIPRICQSLSLACKPARSMAHIPKTRLAERRQAQGLLTSTG